MAILVKVSGSSVGRLFILDSFISNKRNIHEECKGFDMIFVCVIKSVKPPFLDRGDGTKQQPPSQFQKQTNCLYCMRVLSENQKETFKLRYLKGQLKPRVL